MESTCSHLIDSIYCQVDTNIKAFAVSFATIVPSLLTAVFKELSFLLDFFFPPKLSEALQNNSEVTFLLFWLIKEKPRCGCCMYALTQVLYVSFLWKYLLRDWALVTVSWKKATDREGENCQHPKIFHKCMCVYIQQALSVYLKHCLHICSDTCYPADVILDKDFVV